MRFDPHRISVRGGWKATGKTRYRRGFFGKAIVQVEQTEKLGLTDGPDVIWNDSRTRWIDADFWDLHKIVPLEAV